MLSCSLCQSRVARLRECYRCPRWICEEEHCAKSSTWEGEVNWICSICIDEIEDITYVDDGPKTIKH